MMNWCFRATAARALLATVCIAGARADDAARDSLRAGNEHYADGRFDQALESYSQLDPAPEDLMYADVLNNQAAAHFKLGAHEEARELWVRAASLRDAAFEARARYNIGNCHYAEALGVLQPAQTAPMPAAGQPVIAGGEDAPAPPAGNPIESLGRAIENFRDALRLDPSLTNARANMELAAQLKKQLEDQSEQQPQSQPSDDQQQQQNQENQDQEQSAGDQGQPGDQEQQKNDESKEGENEQESQGDQQQEQDKQQQQDQQSGDSEEQADPKEQQQESESQQPQQRDEGDEAEPTSAEPINLSQAEAERLLQMIRDAEQKRREALRAREAAKQKPVDKDW
jgi:Ca-activated chloride channel family protein